MHDVAIVTAVTGAYDHPLKQPHVPGVDMLFYTDGKYQPHNTQWQIKSLPFNRKLDNRRLAKLPKLNPHFSGELQRYTYVIWIDGSMTILRPQFVEEILAYLKNGMVISPHFDAVNNPPRACAYVEATIRPPKYASEPLDEQVAYYKSEGFPERYGLYECGVMARDMRVPEVRALGEMWLEQNLKWSYQDQVSLPYCMWKMDFKPDVLPIPWRDMGWLHVSAHKRES